MSEPREPKRKKVKGKDWRRAPPDLSFAFCPLGDGSLKYEKAEQRSASFVSSFGKYSSGNDLCLGPCTACFLCVILPVN